MLIGVNGVLYMDTFFFLTFFEMKSNVFVWFQISSTFGVHRHLFMQKLLVLPA